MRNVPPRLSWRDVIARETTGEEDRVCKKLLLVGLLVVGVALLSGCDLLDQIIDGITGGAGGPGGGPTTSAYPISGRMKFHLDATVQQDNGFTPPTSYAGSVGTTFWSGAGVHDEDGAYFNAYIWDSGDFSNTAFMVWVNEDEKTIEHFVGNQTQANVWGAYTYYHFIRGVNVPYSHVDENSRYYRVQGTAARTLVTELEFKMWVPGTGSISNPQEWIIGGPAALTGDAGDYIEIRLDYPNTAVPPE